MKTTEEVQQTGLPSLLQIRYLMELEKVGWKRGTVMEIAGKCGVSHPAVSRYLKSCCEKGILNEKYEFTTVGKMMLDRYRTLIDETCVLWDTIFISGGRRGYQLELAPDDLVAFCGATVAPITRED